MRLQDLAPIAILFVVIAIVVSVGADVLSNIQEGKTTDSVEYNATQYGLQGLEELSSWLPTLAIIIVAAIVIGIIAAWFMFKGGR